MSYLKRLGKTLLSMLRELADENAYERHLRSHNAVHSGQEWRRFCEHRLKAKYRRAKCC